MESYRRALNNENALFWTKVNWTTHEKKYIFFCVVTNALLFACFPHVPLNLLNFSSLFRPTDWSPSSSNITAMYLLFRFTGEKLHLKKAHLILFFSDVIFLCCASVPIRCSATNSTAYDEIRPTFLTPVKEPTSDTDSIPSPSTSPVLPRRAYGESITSLGKASILGKLTFSQCTTISFKRIELIIIWWLYSVIAGAASIGKGIGGILFSRFSRSNSQPSVSLGAEGGPPVEEEEQKRIESQSAYGLSSMVRPTSPTADTSR